MKQIIKIFLFLLWAMIVLAGYYYFHKPLLPEQFLRLLTAVVDLVGAAIILAICGGLGYKITRLTGSHRLSAFSIQAALGAGLFSLIWLGLGLAGLLRWWMAVVVLLAGLIILRREIIGWASGLTGWASVWPNAGWLGRIFLLVSVGLALNQLWIALSPPVKYDALSYHLALPSIFASQGRLIFSPENPYWGHPQLVEMLFTWVLALGGEPSSAATLNWLCGVTFLTGLAGFTFEHLPGDLVSDKARASAAAASVIFVLTGATARWMLGWAYTDLFSAWMGLGLLVALFRWHDTGERQWLLFAGIFTGMAVSTKYTAGVIAIALYLGLWLIRYLRKPTIKLWLASGILAVLIFLPWALKNLIYTGNPLFPYLFPTQYYSSERLTLANLPSDDYKIQSQFYLPLYLTWEGVDSAVGPSTDLGPLLVLFAIPALWADRKRPKIQFLGFTLVTGWLIMSVAGARFGHLNQPRLFFVLLPVPAALAGWGWAKTQPIKAAGVRLGRLTTVLACLVIFLVVLQDFSHLLSTGALPTVMGQETGQTYLEENTGVYITAMDTLKSLPADSKVLMLWEARGLYAPANTTPDPWIDRWRDALNNYGSPQSVLSSWRQQGYTHILIYQYGVDFIRENDRGLPADSWERFDEFIGLLHPPSQAAGAYYLLYDLSQP